MKLQSAFLEFNSEGLVVSGVAIEMLGLKAITVYIDLIVVNPTDTILIKVFAYSRFLLTTDIQVFTLELMYSR